jgi:hypothetical protein
MRHHVFCRTSRVLHFHGQASAVVFRNYYNDRSCFQSSSDSGNFEGIALFRFSCERTNLFIRKFRGYVLHVAFPHKRHASNFLLFKSTMGYNIVMRKITWSVDERDLHFSPVCFRTRLSYNRLNQSPFTPPSQIFISYSVDSSVWYPSYPSDGDWIFYPQSETLRIPLEKLHIVRLGVMTSPKSQSKVVWSSLVSFRTLCYAACEFRNWCNGCVGHRLFLALFVRCLQISFAH